MKLKAQQCPLSLFCVYPSTSQCPKAEPQEVAAVGVLPDARQPRPPRLQQLGQLLHILLQGLEVSTLCKGEPYLTI